MLTKKEFHRRYLTAFPYFVMATTLYKGKKEAYEKIDAFPAKLKGEYET